MSFRAFLNQHHSKIGIVVSLLVTFMVSFFLISVIKKFSQVELSYQMPKRTHEYFVTLSENESALKKGEAIYFMRCVECHGGYGEERLRKGKIIPKIHFQTADHLYTKISLGKSKKMPRYQHRLTQEDLEAVVAYTWILVASQKK